MEMNDRIFGRMTEILRGMVRIGPGDSARSRTADEYIILDEIRSGINSYLCMI